MWILLELELQEVLSHFSWVLGNKLKSSEITKEKNPIPSKSVAKAHMTCHPLLPPWQMLQLKHW